MSRKKEFTTAIGAQGMIIDCDDYLVEIFKSDNFEYHNGYYRSIKFTDKKTGDSNVTPFNLFIDWDKEEDGGKITIKYMDRWNSEMIFHHYDPSDLKGMFDFIGRGFNILQAFKK